MAPRPDDGITVSEEQPDPPSLVPAERNVATGRPQSLTHRDKERGRDQPAPRGTRSRPKSRRTRQLVVGGAAAAVLLVGGTVFAVSRAATTASSSAGAPASSNSAAVNQTAGAPASFNSAAVNSSTQPSTSPPTSGPASSNPVSGANPGTARTAPAASTAATGSGVTRRPTAESAFSGTYDAVYKVVAGTGIGVFEIGTTTTATLRVRTDCSGSGGCTTAIAINGTVQKQSEKYSAPGIWTDSFGGSEICRDYYTGKITGGSYPYQVTNVYRATATDASGITKLTGTQKYAQLRKCPKQPNALYTRTIAFTMSRSGP